MKMLRSLLYRLDAYYRLLSHRWRLTIGILLHTSVWLWILLTVAVPYSSWTEWETAQRLKFGLAFFSLAAIFYYHAYDLLPRQIGRGKLLEYLLMMALLIAFFELTHYQLTYELQLFLVWSPKDDAYIIDPGNYAYWLAGPQVTPWSRLIFWSVTLAWGWGRLMARKWLRPESREQPKALSLLWTLHVMFWGVLIASNWEQLGILHYNLLETATVLFLAGVFYVNLYLLNRLDLARGWHRYLMSLLLLITIAWPIEAWLRYLNINRRWDGVLISDLQQSYTEILFSFQDLFFWMIILLSWVYYFFVRNIAERTLVLQTESEHRRAQLSQLRHQIQPHFMLNVLNGLYADALEENSPRTATGIVQLSQMMQHMVYETDRPEIALEKEIKFLKKYVSLQRARLPDKISVNETWPSSPIVDRPIAPLLLLSPIENAFKHGISLQRPSMINIVMTVQGDRLELQVENSLHPKHFQSEVAPRGVGLKNLQDRLSLLYPNRHQLHIRQQDDKFIVSLSIKMHSTNLP